MMVRGGWLKLFYAHTCHCCYSLFNCRGARPTSWAAFAGALMGAAVVLLGAIAALGRAPEALERFAAGHSFRAIGLSLSQPLPLGGGCHCWCDGPVHAALVATQVGACGKVRPMSADFRSGRYNTQGSGWCWTLLIYLGAFREATGAVAHLLPHRGGGHGHVPLCATLPRWRLLSLLIGPAILLHGQRARIRLRVFPALVGGAAATWEEHWRR